MPSIPTTDRVPPPRLLYRVNEAADALSVSRRTIENMIGAGQLPAVRIRSDIRIPAVAVESVAQNGTGPR